MTEALLFTLLVLLMVGLAFTVLIDGYISKAHRNVMLVIVALVLSVIVRGWFDVDGTDWLFRTFIAVYGYAVRPVLLILFGCIVSRKRHDAGAWVLAGINAAIHMTAFFTNICFAIHPVRGFYRGPLGYTSHVVSAVLLLRLIWLTLSEHRNAKRLELFIPLFNALIIVAAAVADSFIIKADMRLSCVDGALVSCSLFYYIWLHLQFVREHEQTLVTGQQAQLMLSQIKPHFLHNALGTIEELCDSDPKAAKAATVMFSDYLRANMDAISSQGTIPFERELAHTKLYLELEQLRFGDALRVRYDIGCTGFLIPSLTLQPLAENAVRHGVRKTPRGEGPSQSPRGRRRRALKCPSPTTALVLIPPRLTTTAGRTSASGTCGRGWSRCAAARCGSHLRPVAERWRRYGFPGTRRRADADLCP